MCSPSRSPLPPLFPPDPSGSSQCTSPEHLSHASNLGWWSASPLIIYMFRWAFNTLCDVIHIPCAHHTYHLKETIQWHLVYSQGYETISTNQFYNIFIMLKRNSISVLAPCSPLLSTPGAYKAMICLLWTIHIGEIIQYVSHFSHLGFPGSSLAEGKMSACNSGDLGLIPRLGGSPGEGNGHPLQYSCLESATDRGMTLRLQSVGSKKAVHDWAMSLSLSITFSKIICFMV